MGNGPSPSHRDTGLVLRWNPTTLGALAIQTVVLLIGIAWRDGTRSTEIEDLARRVAALETSSRETAAQIAAQNAIVQLALGKLDARSEALLDMVRQIRGERPIRTLPHDEPQPPNNLLGGRPQ